MADAAATGGCIAEEPVNSVPMASSSVVGHCITCACPWDDYSNRARCSRCRMLVLLCNSCRQQQLPQQQQGVLCALCGMQSRRCHSRKARRRAAAERATAEQLEIKGAQTGEEEEQVGASSHSTSTSRCSPTSIRLPGGRMCSGWECITGTAGCRWRCSTSRQAADLVPAWLPPDRLQTDGEGRPAVRGSIANNANTLCHFTLMLAGRKLCCCACPYRAGPAEYASTWMTLQTSTLQ